MDNYNYSIKGFSPDSDFNFRAYLEELADDIEEIQQLQNKEEREIKTDIIDSKIQYLFQNINDKCILENRILKFIAAVRLGWAGRGRRRF